MTKIYTISPGLRWLISLLLLIVTAPLKAQTGQSPTIQWQRVLDWSFIAQVAKASTGGSALAYDVKVLRLSESGSTIWQTSMPDSPTLPPGYPNTVKFITSVPDGGFAVVTQNSFKWSLGRLNAEGTVLWLKPFADNEPSSSLTVRSITDLIHTADGGFLVLGHTQQGRGGLQTDIYKFDVEGNKTLTSGLGSGNVNPGRTVAAGLQIVQASDGTYVLVGRANTNDGVITAWAARFSLTQQLNLVWRKNYAGKELEDVIRNPYTSDSFIAIGADDAGGTRTLLIGSDGEMTPGFTQPNRQAGTKSFLVAPANLASRHTIVDVVNENGGDWRLQNLSGQNQNWLKKIGGSSAEVLRGVIATNDGGHLVVGTTASTDGDVQGKTTTDPVAWIVKLGPTCEGDIFSVQDGEWGNPATWSCGRVPTSADIVHVNHHIVLPQNFVANARGLVYDLPIPLRWETGARLQLSE